MGKLSIDEFERQLAAVPVEEPDEWDLQMLAEIAAETDSGTITLEEMRRVRERRECADMSLAQQISGMVEQLPQRKQSLVYELVSTLMTG